jgi:uncharacterized protein YndB with AHSA1/START domain
MHRRAKRGDRMSKRFEDVTELDVTTTPEQVWDAIATGPGIDSWFMGRSDVEPGQVVRTAFGSFTPEQPVTAWEPPNRLAYGSVAGPDGRFVAYEFLVEGRAGGSTVIRAVTSGFLPGDDWEAEYDAMTKGMAMFYRTLAEYLNHFAGRTARPITVFGPPVRDWAAAWTSLFAALSMQGDGVRVPVPGQPPAYGVVYFRNPHTVGIRTDTALYRFLRGFGGQLIASHHIFDGTDTEAAWQRWLDGLYS